MPLTTDFHRHASPIEQEITRKLLAAIFSEVGRSVRTNDGADGWSALLFSPDEVYPLLASTAYDVVKIYDDGKPVGKVWLIWGNDEDLLSDWTDNEGTNAIVDPLLVA